MTIRWPRLALAIDPHRCVTQLSGGDDVVLEAETGVPDVRDGQAQALASQEKALVGGLVGTRLLGRDDVVELDADGALGFGDDIVVRVRNKNCLRQLLELKNGLFRVSERLPPAHGAGEFIEVLLGVGNLLRIEGHAHRVVQHLAVGTVLLLDVDILDLFPLVLQRARVHALDVMRGQSIGEKLLNAALPIYESTVAVESNRLR
jgi:hypothetical protein